MTDWKKPQLEKIGMSLSKVPGMELCFPIRTIYKVFVIMRDFIIVTTIKN